MKLEILLSTMNQKDLSIIKDMNIRGNVLIVNQSDFHDYCYLDNSPEQVVKMYSFAERGIGLSRNTALMRASGDICLLADDDVVYKEDYEQIVLQAFRDYPYADVILFNVPSMNIERKGPASIDNVTGINFFNFMRYGAVNIAFKKESVTKANIFFSLLYGGGAKYNAGEDTLFLYDCLHKGLKVIGYPREIGKVKQEGSSWFTGFNEKYFFDKGVLYTNLSKKLSYFLILQFAIRKHQIYREQIKFTDALRYMIKGRKNFISQRDIYE